MEGPRDPGALRAALERVTGDPDRADTLREKGMKRAAEFSWEHSARAHLEAYTLAVQAR